VIKDLGDPVAPLAGVRTLHPYDEDYEAVAAPWLTFVPLALSRAPTEPINLELLSALVERCKEE
jgi:hypothetical protein